MDHFIQPLATQVKSYIRDTTDLLCKLEQNDTILENLILVTMDVKSLYSNIRHDKGLATLTKCLNDRPIKEPDTKVITTLMEHILNLNSFTFNNKFYLQTKGCAMGTVAAPSYAIIYMGEFEETHIYPLIIEDVLFMPDTLMTFFSSILEVRPDYSTFLVTLIHAMNPSNLITKHHGTLSPS